MESRVNKVIKFDNAWPPEFPIEHIPIDEQEPLNFELDAAREIQELTLIVQAARRTQELAEKRLAKRSTTINAPEGLLFSINDWDVPLRIQELVALRDQPGGTQHEWIDVQDTGEINHFFADRLVVQQQNGLTQFAVLEIGDGRYFRCAIQHTTRIRWAKKPSDN